MKKTTWALLCVAAFFPITAVLHHAVFFRPTCILNPTHMDDYTLTALKIIASSDPSLWIGFGAALLLYAYGARPLTQRATIAFIIGFAPLTLWIWDIPGTGRWICHHFHDGRSIIHSRHLYEFGAIAALVLYGAMSWFHRKPITIRPLDSGSPLSNRE